MEKQRLFKMTMVDRNFLMQGLRNYSVSVQNRGGNSEAVNALIRKTMAVTGGKLFLDELEYALFVGLTICVMLTCRQAEAVAESTGCFLSLLTVNTNGRLSGKLIRLLPKLWDLPPGFGGFFIYCERKDQ